MDPITFQRLEFPVVLERLGKLAESDAAREGILNTRPWTDEQTIRKHSAAVGEITRILDEGDRFPIAGFDDCGEPIDRLGVPNSVLSAPEWMRLRALLKLGANLRRWCERQEETIPRIWETAKQIDALPDLKRRIDSVFDEHGQVRDNASPELQQCRSEIARCEREIAKVFDRLLSKLGDKVLQDNYATDRNGRQVLPIRASGRSRCPGIVHGSSNTGETLFIEPMDAVEPTNRLSEAHMREQEEIARILATLTDAARADLPPLGWTRQALVQLDLWHARAKLANRHGLHRPDVHEGASMHLMQAHHPLLYFNDPKKSIPLSLQLDAENHVLIITGPNTGGKTTALKTIGLLALMAQSAIPVPAGVDSKVPVFAQVLAEMGDDQSVAAGLSTFSAHVRRISSILETCGDNALVLLDELGKATDPLQAGALGRAILEELTRQGALTFVTTHLPTLKDWAHEHPSGRNASYSLDPETHRPEYRMHMDTPGLSEAFTIARAEGLPEAIVDAAIAGLPKQERELNDLLTTLHEREAELAERMREAREATERNTEDSKRLRAERDEWEKRKVHADRNLEKDYKKMLDEARKRLERRIADLPSRQALSQAREELARDQKAAANRLDKLAEREERILREDKVPKHAPDEDWEPVAGAWAFIGTSDQPGRIERLNEQRQEATLSLGGLSITAPLKQLRPARPPEEKAPSAPPQRGGPRPEVRPEIELIGQRVEPALETLDKYLDQAALANLDKVRIVHGFGTGALRNGVHEFLRNHPHVRRFKLAAEDDGAAAVTIATLK